MLATLMPNFARVNERCHRRIYNPNAAVNEEDADTVAVGSAGNSRKIGGLVNDHADIPGHFQGTNAENVLPDLYRISAIAATS